MSKLVMCKECDAILNVTKHVKSCDCGHVRAVEVEPNKIEYTGNAVVIGINDKWFSRAVYKQQQHIESIPVKLKILPKYCDGDYYKQVDELSVEDN